MAVGRNSEKQLLTQSASYLVLDANVGYHCLGVPRNAHGPSVHNEPDYHLIYGISSRNWHQQLVVVSAIIDRVHEHF
ncbi:MAG: hypothetical protein FRX49_10900 [Trebouxia sp. A1-2]|nr:MAG: hypothetical protein FRX49_10900 [Trebouxia sp. A1-2]